MVSIVETVIGTAAANTTTNFTITTALVPSDVVVAIISRGSGSPSTTISGLSGTWNSAFNKTANTRAQAHWLTGRTGGGTVSVQVFAPIDTSRVVLHVVRGLNVSALTNASYSTWTNATGADTTPAIDFKEGQIAFSVAISTNPGTATFPYNQLPSSGWVTDDVFTSGGPPLFTGHVIADSSSTTVRAGIDNGGNTSGAAVLVFGAPVAQPAAPVPGSPVVVERKLVELPASTTTAIGLNTLLDPTDIVIISMYHNQIVLPTLTYGTLTNTYRLVNYRRINAYDHYATWSYGGSGATTLTIHPNNAATEAFIYVIRGTTTRTLEYNLQTEYGAASVITSKSTLTGEARPGQMAILLGMREGAISSSTITGAGSSGWVQDSNGALMSFSQAITAETNLQATLTIGTGGYMGAALLVFGEGSTRAPSPAATIVHRKTISIPNTDGDAAVTEALGFDVQPTDVVVTILQKGFNGSTFQMTADSAAWNSVTPAGASWWPIFYSTIGSSWGPDVAMWAIRGVSGTTNLTFAVALSSGGGSAIVLVIRGLKDIGPATAVTPGLGVGNTAPTYTTPYIERGEGTVFVGMGWRNTSTLMESPTPLPTTETSGWTQEYFPTTAEGSTSFRMKVISKEPTTSINERLGMTMNDSTTMVGGAFLAAFGTTGSAGITSFIGWGMQI